MSYNPNFSGISIVPEATSSKAVQLKSTNMTGSALTKLTPVRLNSSGNMESIDVSIEAQALAIAGLLNTDVMNGTVGEIANSGRIADILTASIGDVLYVSKSGGTTNIKPEIGVDGFVADDFVIRLGVVIKNVDNPLLKDLLVNISIVGQL
jgi:hypothetical protein